MNELAEVLSQALNGQKKQQAGSDYTAVVKRVDGQTAYVQITGSDIADTPVALTIGAKPGDTVRVRVADGRAWITGNDTAPPTDDTEIKEAVIQIKDGVDSLDNIVIKSGNFTLDEAGNVDFSGKLKAAGGTFTGTLEGVDGSFSGTLDAAKGTFTGSIEVTSGSGSSSYLKIPGDEGALEINVGNKSFIAAFGATEMSLTQNSLDAYGDVDDCYRMLYMNLTTISLNDFINNNSSALEPNRIHVYNGNKHVYIDGDGVHGPSDSRLKDEIRDLDPEPARQLRPVRFRFKDSDKIHYGFIAQEVQKSLPDTVSKDDRGYLMLNYQELIAPLYALVQEQEKRITQLEERLKALEDKQ